MPTCRGVLRTAIHGAARCAWPRSRGTSVACTTGVRVLAPTHEQAHDVVRHVLADAPASLGVERAGWVGFSVRLATPALIARGLTPVSRLGFEAIVARVVARARDEGVLAFFAERAGTRVRAVAGADHWPTSDWPALPAAALDDGTAKGRDLAWLLGGRRSRR